MHFLKAFSSELTCSRVLYRYPDYKYRPQKKKDRKTRKYTRRPQNKFTSRIEKNNEMMELFYNNPRMLDTQSYSVALHEHHLQQQQIMSPASSPLYTSTNSPASSSVTQDDLVLSPACYDEQQPMIVGSSSPLFYQQSVAEAAMYYNWSVMPNGPSCMNMPTTTTNNVAVNAPCVTPENIADPQMALVDGCIDPNLLTNTTNTSTTLSYPPVITVNDTGYFENCYKSFHEANNNDTYMSSCAFEQGYDNNMQA